MQAWVSGGLFMAWWMIIPGIGIAAMWLMAVVADRELEGKGVADTRAR
ncbi:MAG: hypothetical protein AAF721_10100 [Myxococcota bacterium]